MCRMQMQWYRLVDWWKFHRKTLPMLLITLLLNFFILSHPHKQCMLVPWASLHFWYVTVAFIRLNGSFRFRLCSSSKTLFSMRISSKVCDSYASIYFMMPPLKSVQWQWHTTLFNIVFLYFFIFCVDSSLKLCKAAHFPHSWTNTILSYSIFAVMQGRRS